MIEHYWLELPGPMWFSGADIYARFVAGVSGPAVAVELGAWKGRSTCFMGVEIANSGKQIEFTTIDHWQGSEGEHEQEADDDVANGQLFEVFLHNIEPVAQHVRVIRSDTVQAASHFQDESIDFLYVDAAHDYEGVMRDLRAWYRKVKIGGLIAGDDWPFEVRGHYTVRQAVLDFFGKHSGQLTIEPGSGSNRDWLQWSIVKSSDLRLDANASRLSLRALRAIQRRLPARYFGAARLRP